MRIVLRIRKAFSTMHSVCMSSKLRQSCPTLCDPMDYSLPGSSIQGFSRQEYWSGLPCPPPGDLPDQGIEPTSLMFPASADGFFTNSATWDTWYQCPQHMAVLNKKKLLLSLPLALVPLKAAQDDSIVSSRGRGWLSYKEY